MILPIPSSSDFMLYFVAISTKIISTRLIPDTLRPSTHSHLHDMLQCYVVQQFSA